MTLSEPTADPTPDSPADHPADEDGPRGRQGAPDAPTYKGAPLDAERGPGLGCFWIQVGLLVFLLVATPISVVLAFPPWVSAAMLILTLVILFFVGQTMIFLLRLVAADRRAQRRPLREGARKTVGQLESDAADSRKGPDQNSSDHQDSRTGEG